ncbi:MAG: hypothetical protein IKF90_21255 [Parasporobacterium sp.]|nr:hypothetical protein [Parasporobacterium sp.]
MFKRSVRADNGDRIQEKWNKEKVEILVIMDAEGNEMTVADIASSMKGDYSEKSIRFLLNQLLEEGLVMKKTINRKPYYFIVI